MSRQSSPETDAVMWFLGGVLLFWPIALAYALHESLTFENKRKYWVMFNVTGFLLMTLIPLGWEVYFLYGFIGAVVAALVAAWNSEDSFDDRESVVKHKSKVLAVSAAIAVGLSLFIATPAEACEEPHPSPSPSAAAPVSTVDTVRVTQQDPGSLFALLEWPAVAGASEYRIFKTGSIRPRWRLFWITPRSLTQHTIADKPGSIAIYRVVALVNNREKDLGEFIYRPMK